MVTYYKHKATQSRNVPYSFQCEHCMKDSGTLSAVIAGAEEAYDSPHKTLPEDKKAKLNERARANLAREARQIYENATTRQLFAPAFQDQCPHCGQPQSWAISGKKNHTRSGLRMILMVGVIVSGGIYFSQGRNLMLLLASAAIFAVAAGGYFIINQIRLKAQQNKVDTARRQNLPTIDWTPLEDLLGETADNAKTS